MRWQWIALVAMASSAVTVGAGDPAARERGADPHPRTPADLAKRAAPVPLPPVVIDSVVYSAPHAQMGFLVATDARSGQELWRVRVYGVPVDSALERDVQDVFITALGLQNGALVVTNERGDRYSVDLATRKVTRFK